MALLTVNFFSSVLGINTQMEVILPQQTSGQIGMETVGASSYPVLYLLHGLSDDQTVWERRTSIERYVSDLGMAVVMPTTHRCWYTDKKDGTGNYFTFVTKELPAICHEFFPRISLKREDTFVAGLSMGGYGAFKLALSCPDQYGAAISLSGVLDMAAWGEDAEKHAVFGPTVTGTENDLFYLAQKLQEEGKNPPKLYQWCGTEDFLYSANTKMRDYLNNTHYFDFTYHESPGYHAWECWDEQIQPALRWLPIQR